MVHSVTSERTYCTVPSLLEVFLLNQFQPFLLFPVSQLLQSFAVFSKSVKGRRNHLLGLTSVLFIFLEQQRPQPHNTTSTFNIIIIIITIILIFYTLASKRSQGLKAKVKN